MKLIIEIEESKYKASQKALSIGGRGDENILSNYLINAVAEGTPLRKEKEAGEMINEEAIRIFKSELDWAEQNRYPYISENKVKAIKLAIKALEQQLMRDATEEERKSVKDYIESISKPTGFNFYEAQPCEDCISREAAIKNIKGWFDKIGLNPDILIDSMITLPAIIPERPKGKWIEVLEYKDENISTWHYECSKCGAKSYKCIEPLEKYCHNCGAEMSEGEENVEG